MDAALGHKVKQAKETGVNVEEGHTEGHDGGDLDKFIFLSLFHCFGRS